MASPLSPENVPLPFPATVVMMPVAASTFADTAVALVADVQISGAVERKRGRTV